MAETPDGQQKTEPASGKKFSDARSRGQVAKSIDATNAAVLLIGGMVAAAFAVPMLQKQMDFMRSMFMRAPQIILTDESITRYYPDVIMAIAVIVLPLLGIIAAVVVAAEVGQTGFTFATKKFTEGLNFAMIFNVFQGMKRIFGSARSIAELLKSIVKLLLVGAVLYQVLNRRSDEIAGLAAQPYQHIGALIGSVIMELLWKIGAIYLLIGAADLFFQRYKFRDDLKMTKQEVKEETKQSEGDVEVKARLRQLAKQRLKRIMLQNVKKADVVIVNPTHYAVALEYKPGMSAPKVIAKGVDFLALKIRELAAEYNVPIVENPPLARALYAAVEVDTEIPENLFKTVAQVLAFIYRQRKKAS